MPFANLIVKGDISPRQPRSCLRGQVGRYSVAAARLRLKRTPDRAVAGGEVVEGRCNRVELFERKKQMRWCHELACSKIDRY